MANPTSPQTLRAALAIPADIQNLCLPYDDMPLLDFINLPKPSLAPPFSEATNIFCENKPTDLSAGHLAQIDIPTEDDVKALANVIEDAWDMGVRSLQGLDPTVHCADLPLWFITYAEKMHQIETKRQKWSKVRTSDEYRK
jgi:hypothetical protein